MKKHIQRTVIAGLISTGLVLAPTMAFADSAVSPTPNTSPSASSTTLTDYQAAMVQYRNAMVQYRIAIVNNDISYRVAMEKYWAVEKTNRQSNLDNWQAAITAFRTAVTAYEAKLVPIRAAHKAAMDAADNAFLAATSSTATNDALTIALKTYWAAVKAANDTYKSAVSALGAEPVKPIQPSAPIKMAPPVKPADPTKPVLPVKPIKVAKAPKPAKTPRVAKASKPVKTK